MPALALEGATLFTKHRFGACGEAGLLDLVPVDTHIVVVGCEAHVCVLQTVVELCEAGRDVFLVRDAIGSRASENKQAAIDRMRGEGANVVTTEMAIFEWLRTSQHTQFRSLMKLIR